MLHSVVYGTTGSNKYKELEAFKGELITQSSKAKQHLAGIVITSIKKI